MKPPVIVAALVAGFVVVPSAQLLRLDPFAMLDRYATGQFDDALRPLRTATPDQVADLRTQLAAPPPDPRDKKNRKKDQAVVPLVSAGRVWVDRAPADRARRILVAASFALEMEAVLAERGQWNANRPADCAGRCVVEWACTLLGERAVTGDGAERAWFAASFALAGGVRDWTFVNAPIVSSAPFGEQTGHVGHALARFPADSEFRMAQALAVASRYETTTEMDAPRSGVRLEARPFVAFSIGGDVGSALANRRRVIRAAAVDALSTLAADPVVAASAGTHLAYLHWAAGEYDRAVTAAETAASRAGDADSRYLARYVGGLAAQSSGDLSAAERLYESALAARPHSQSAVLALAALRFQRGAAKSAYGLVETSLAERKDDDDPWRLFLYGNYPKWPGLLNALRAVVQAGARP